MKASEYFGDWMDVIDTAELRKILSWISTIDKTTLCPSSPNIFKAFRACPLKDSLCALRARGLFFIFDWAACAAGGVARVCAAGASKE